MRDKTQLFKDIVTDILTYGKKRAWTAYALDEGLSVEHYERCRSRWKAFKKDYYPKGLWAKDEPIPQDWITKVEKAIAIESGSEIVIESPDGFTASKIYQQQTKNGDIVWLQSAERDKDVDAAKEFYDKSIAAYEDIILNYEPKKIYLLPHSNPTNWGMNVYISDAHIGADIQDSLFGIEYSKEIYLNRIRSIVDVIESKFQMYGTFHTINVILVGDNVDGFNQMTTRGGHKLPQNLNDAEQFDTFVKSQIDLFNTIVQEGFASKIRFASATNSNHGGDAEYAASRAVEIYLNAVFPDIETKVSRDFVFHIKTGNRVHLICHGKDRANMKFSIPFNLSKDHEMWIENYIQYHGLNKHIPFNQEKQFITLVLGDLHQSKTEFSKRFTHKRVMALTPPNDYADYNYSRGSGYSGFEVDVFSVDGPETHESRHFFF